VNAQVEPTEAAEREKRGKGEEREREREREGRRRLTPGSGNFGIAHSQFTANSFKLYLFPNIHPILQAAPLCIYIRGVPNSMQFLSYGWQYRGDTLFEESIAAAP